MKKLVIIPARGGSKRLPNKNIKLLNGEPLIMHSVSTARSLFEDIEICVSTESKEIKKIVEKSGLKVPFMRPIELAKDDSTSEDVLIHALNWYQKHLYQPDIIIVLQPTSPFRKTKHINDIMNKFSDKIDMVVSVKEAKSNPYFNLYEENDNGFLKKTKESNYTRFQDCPKVWELNGSVYAINPTSLKHKGFSNFNKIIKYEIKEPELSIDIDTKFDFNLCELIIKEQI